MSQTTTIQASKVEKLTDVQVRIYNSQLNFKAALSIALSEFPDYVNKLKKESYKWHRFLHLPLVSFVDRDDMEEVVFESEEDFPDGPCDIVTRRGELIAKLT